MFGRAFIVQLLFLSREELHGLDAGVLNWLLLQRVLDITLLAVRVTPLLSS